MCATEDVEKTVKTCKSSEQLLKLLSLWRIKNGDQDTRKGLLHALKHLKTYHFPKTVIQSLKKTIRFLHSFTMYRLQLLKNPPAMQETLVRFLGQEDPLEKR